MPTKLNTGQIDSGKFIEFFGQGAKDLSLPDRATIANMAPEYGATCGFFPTDIETINYQNRKLLSHKLLALVLDP